MSVDFRTQSITIPSGLGRRHIQGSAIFDSSVIRATVALNGFKLNYVSGDNHSDIVEVDTDIVSISGNVVIFAVECDYADKNADDEYEGYVTTIVLAEVA